ncbi:enhancer of polycomb homolog 2 [Engraulis encrasicolus]|uniref:enhancer of polycomb homolog 2 n=1 Tax=Engraulis encrasicolus TaxID=184585 RepID=UPI002FD6DC15
MSKLSFRARALDAAKPLPIYRNRDLPDLNDCVSINRAVPQMPTGMEKEEESEHHLQRAISAQQVFREKKECMVIPVPEAESNVTYYDRLYKGEFRIPKQLIHLQPLGLDNEQPDYDMDSEDETLLNRLNRKMEIKPLQFEVMVDRLEKASANQLVTLPEAKLLLNEDDYLLKSVYDYWVRKRKGSQAPSLIPSVKQEKRDGSTNNDAYVAFRRRTEKMQTRKNRKNDEASYEKMLKLRREFSRTVTILEMIKKREKSKRELLHLTLEVVEKRYHMGDFSGEILNEVSAPLAEKPVYQAPIILPNGNRYKVESKLKAHKSSSHQHPHHFSMKPEPHFDFVRPHKKYTKRPKLDPLRPPGRVERHHTVNKADIKQYDFHSSGEDDYPLSPASEPDEENDPDGAFAFRRRAGCHYLAPLQEQSSTSPWGHLELPGVDPLRQRHSLTALTVPRRCIGLARRRVGRGGRVLLDRASSHLDRALRLLDPDVLCRSASSSSSASATLELDFDLPDLRHDSSSSSSSFSPHMATKTNTATFSTTSPTSSSMPAKRSLAQLLSDIQSCRWRCFRPRPTPEERHADAARKGSGLLADGRTRESTAASMAATDATRTKEGMTEEQYQTHQQQLAQMHKQQLQQVLQRTQANTTTTTTTPERKPTQTAVTSEGVLKVLDSASAHFAASAVVSSPNNENKGHPPTVNGTGPGSGGSRGLKFTSSSSQGGGGGAGGGGSSSARSSSSPAGDGQSRGGGGGGGGSSNMSGNGHSNSNGGGGGGNSAPQSLPRGHTHLGSVSAVSPAHTHHSARPSAPSPSALKLAAVASSLDRVPKLTAASAVDSLSRENHEPERLALNGISETTVAMEVT